MGRTSGFREIMETSWTSTLDNVQLIVMITGFRQFQSTNVNTNQYKVLITT